LSPAAAKAYGKLQAKLKDSTSPLQGNMAMLVQTLSLTQILIPKIILLNKYLKPWKSDRWP